MRADLSLQQAPPFSVPARFLVSAPIFGLLAALVLIWQGPEMLQHRWTPELLAVTHFLTLGFLAMSMMGAMLQLLPVLMGTVIHRPVLFSSIIHSSLFLGSACLGLAWLAELSQLFVIAMAFLAISFVTFITVLSERLIHSSNRHVTRSMMLFALFALLVTVSLGLVLASGHTWESITLARQLTDLHLGWGMAGWVLMLIMAVAYHVIPMFQITDEYPDTHQRWMGWTVLISMVTLSTTYVWPQESILTISLALLAVCMLVFALTTLRLLHNRRRQLPDLTLNFWRLSMISLVLLATSWLVSIILGMTLPAVFAGVLIIHGFAMTAVNGMMYKIIPFLIWLHLSARNKTLRDQGRREMQIKVPHMRNIIPEAAGLWQFRFHLGSLVLLVLAAIWTGLFYYLAVLLFFIAQVFLLFNLVNAVRFYNIKIAELKRAT